MRALLAGDRFLTRGHGAFIGGLASRLTPAFLQLVFIVLVAQRGTLADVGRLALASALAFLCGALGEAGALTSLSLPRAYFGQDSPPLRATRRLRWLGALGGSALYAILWVAGQGSHEPVFLVALPLPLLLALSSGYAGALNATQALGLEGAVSVAESAAAVGVAVSLLIVLSPLAACLIGLIVGRGIGTLARGLALRSLPQSTTRRVAGFGRTQAAFLASTATFVLQGQMDLLVLGFFGAFSLLGVFAPLIRTCYSTFLVAEGLTLAMYTKADETGSRAAWPLRHWRASGILLGVLAGVAFALLGAPVVRLVVGHDVHGLTVPVLLLALLVPIRFVGYVWSVAIVRAGRQAARIPILAIGAAILAVGGAAGALAHSLTWLCALRVGSEIAVAAGFAGVMRRTNVDCAHHHQVVAPLEID